MVVISLVGLTSLIDSFISFLTAFGLEVLLHSDTLWAKLPVVVVLAVMALLVCWCAWTPSKTEAGCCLLSRVHILKEGLVGFTRRLRSKVTERRPDVEGAGNGDGQGKTRGGMLSRSVVLKDAFNRLRPRRPRNSTPRTVFDPTGSNASGPSDTTVVEMGETDHNAPGSAV